MTKTLPPKSAAKTKRSGVAKQSCSVFGGVIFDIDNVLIDTRQSYLEAIRWTVDLFLTEGKVPFFEGSTRSAQDHLLSTEHVAQFKLLGGFNDDWDCCYGLLNYLLSLKISGHSIGELRRAIDLPGFAASVRARPLGVSGIVKKLGRNPYVTIEKISRIFQEVYLGRELFEAVEKRSLSYWQKSGLIRKEKLLFRKSTLLRLKSLGLSLGITTGRSRFEALYALRRFGIQELFDAITTMDEIRTAEEKAKQSLRKPHPFSLLETYRKMKPKKPVLYVGDLPDDVLTAKRAAKDADILAVGFPRLSSAPKETFEAMKRLKAEFMLERPSDLMDLVLSK